MRHSSSKAIQDKATELAMTGQYADANELIWTLFKQGFSRAGDEIGFFERRRLDRSCREARNRKLQTMTQSTGRSTV